MEKTKIVVAVLKTVTYNGFDAVSRVYIIDTKNDRSPASFTFLSYENCLGTMEV